MIICPECGTQVEKGICLCPNCGEEMLYNRRKSLGSCWLSFKHQFDREKVYSAISYIGFLGIVPLLSGKNSSLTMFHINQGLSLMIAEIIYGIFYFVLKKLLLKISIWLYPIVAVAGVTQIIFLIFAIIGIVSAFKGEKRELPLISGLRILKIKKHS